MRQLRDIAAAYPGRRLAPAKVLLALAAVVLAIEGALSSTYWLLAFLLVAFTACALLEPLLAVCIFFVSQIFLVGASIGVDTTEIAFSLMFIILFLTWIARKVVRGERLIPRNTLVVWTFVFVGYCAFSVVNSLRNGLLLSDWFADINPLVVYLLIPVVADAVDSRKKLKALHTFVLVICIFFGTIGALNAALGRGFLAQPIFGLQLSIPASPDFLIAGPFLAWGCAVYATKTTRRIAYAFLGSHFLLLALITGTRGYLAIIFIGICALIYLQVRKRSIGPLLKAGITFILVLIIFLVAVLSSGFLTQGIDRAYRRFSTAFSPNYLRKDASYLNRRSEHIESLKVWSTSPVFGKGLGYKLKTRWQRGTYGDKRAEYRSDLFVHNTFSFLIIKLGAVGLIAFGAFVVVFVRGAYRALDLAPDPFSKGVFLGLICMLVALVGTAVVHPTLQRRTAALILGLLGGSVVAALRLASSVQGRRDSAPQADSSFSWKE